MKWSKIHINNVVDLALFEQMLLHLISFRMLENTLILIDSQTLLFY